MTPKIYAQRTRRLIILVACTLTALSCTGNQNLRDTELHIQSRAHPDAPTPAGFDHGSYSVEGKSAITVLLTEGPPHAPRRALIVRMFWRPKAAATPLDETATNSTVQYIVFGESPDGPAGKPTVGVYSGGGFLYPENEVGSQNLQANLWQATMSLADKNAGFHDTLGPSILTGRFSARRDDEGIVEAIRQVNIAVSEALGVPRFVRAE